MTRKKATIKSNGDELELEKETEETKLPVMSAPNLRDLIFLGSIEKVIDIGGFKFKIRTLSGRQQKAALAKTMRHDEEERLSVLRTSILASAIVDVNGVPLEDTYDGDDLDTDLDRKMFVVEGLQTSVVDRLYLAYDGLTKQSSADVEENTLKK
jgi:hypothetical protein